MFDLHADALLEYEAADLRSFLQLGIMFGWDMHLIPTAGDARAFVSHDEFVEYVASDEATTRAFPAELRGGRVIAGSTAP